MLATLFLLVMYGNLGVIASTGIHEKDNCAACDPGGVRTTVAPSIGTDDLGKFYESLLASVKGIQFSQRSLPREDTNIQRRAQPAPICCAQLTQCLLLPDYGLPFCYDKFTTNFFLQDGSYGTLHSGNYTAKSGDQVNLISGDLTAAGGAHSNIYTSNSGSKPNTATLIIPSQWTSSGIGSAIPASALGIVVTTILGPTVIPGTTTKATIVPARTVSGSTVAVTTIAGTTVAAQTFTAPTTITFQTGFSTPSSAPSTLVSTKRKNVSPSSERSLGTIFGIWILAIFLQ